MSQQKAIAQALVQCSSVLIDNPSLVVQLENLETSGGRWDADVRVMALQKNDDKARKRKGAPSDLETENPEHAISGNPNAWRPPGMKHDGPPVAFRFGNAAVAGELPNVPLQDIHLSNYEVAKGAEPEIRRLLHDIQQIRHKSFTAAEPDVD